MWHGGSFVNGVLVVALSVNLAGANARELPHPMVSQSLPPSEVALPGTAVSPPCEQAMLPPDFFQRLEARDILPGEVAFWIAETIRRTKACALAAEVRPLPLFVRTALDERFPIALLQDVFYTTEWFPPPPLIGAIVVSREVGDTSFTVDNVIARSPVFGSSVNLDSTASPRATWDVPQSSMPKPCGRRVRRGRRCSETRAGARRVAQAGQPQATPRSRRPECRGTEFNSPFFEHLGSRRGPRGRPFRVSRRVTPGEPDEHLLENRKSC
jgi:hypothetical protein